MRVSVNNGPCAVRYVLVECPISHRDLIRLQKDLYSVGIVVPLLEIINCGLTSRDILDTSVARKWLREKNRIIQRIFMPDIAMVDEILKDKFQGFLSGVNINCKAVDYDKGELILEVSHDVKWDVLSCYLPKR